MDYMLSLVEENSTLAFVTMDKGSCEYDERIRRNEEIIGLLLGLFLMNGGITNLGVLRRMTAVLHYYVGKKRYIP